jgi:long-chain acyl-CoA synthetase
VSLFTPLTQHYPFLDLDLRPDRFFRVMNPPINIQRPELESMHPTTFAQLSPDKVALIDADTAKTLTYRQLNELANQGAHALRYLGLNRGDVVAVLLDNGFEIFEIAWAAQRAGLYLTSISTRLTTADVGYILEDSGARSVIASDRLSSIAAAARDHLPNVQGFATTTEVGRLKSWKALRESQPTSAIPDESPGTDMLYSSGTTGRPKGVRPPLPSGEIFAATHLMGMASTLYDMRPETVYLSTSPLYHAAPQRWALTVQRIGGTVIYTDKFDAERTLALIEKYRVTHATFVPTHFIRMLKLPAAVRERYDHSSLEAVVHAAAPCPVPVKHAMIKWWGPIVHEYYSGTETCGITALNSEEWLNKPGSVGRAVVGTVKITDDLGNELPPNQVGNIYFADGPTFEYHNDPVKTAEAYDRHGWATMGDIGHIDEDGYLYLSDRKNFMIISGGVNIYPQEIENLIVTHPKVADVAVIGAPDGEMGEKVVAVVQPVNWMDAGTSLAEELRSFARAALGGVKCPKEFHFPESLPREPTGKLMKRLLRDEYRGAGC